MSEADTLRPLTRQPIRIELLLDGQLCSAVDEVEVTIRPSWLFEEEETICC